ncbi:protein PML-like [Dreissena polymorpha]|uniref:protein PML-like n=1 Tax=Dreissena polymorpha TaxID=45954 RepID=UPI002263E410|nr:protein PML-like [Dreissena polymorpha]
MATFLQSTIDKGSDILQDFLCSTCEDKKLDNMADFYCETCVKFYCGKCIGMHSQLFIKHAPYGRGDLKKWPVAKQVEDFLLKCDVHKDKNLELFCDNHIELCCTNCAILNHRHCQKITLISDIVKSQSTDLQQLSVSIQTILKELKKLQDNQEASIQYVQSSYDEQLHKIQNTRREINVALDTIEQKTRKEMLDTLTKLQASTKSEADKCIRLRDELKRLRDATQDISDKSKQELSFIATRKCEGIIKQSKTFLNSTLQDKFYISFQPNSEIVQYLTTLSGLGKIEPMMVQDNPNKVITVQGKSEHNVKISGDSNECNISAILVLPAKQVLVADFNNKSVKLLDQQYQVVSHCSVTGYPLVLCDITPSEVAVAVNETDMNINEVQFITVNNRQLVLGRKLQLQHACIGIAFQKGDMYITDKTALYKYTLNGKLVSKMYKDTSGRYTGKNHC